MTSDNIDTNTEHIPVLLSETLEILHPLPGASYLDCTAGRGGHARAIIAAGVLPQDCVLIDRDLEAIAYLQNDPELAGCRIIHDTFEAAARKLASQGIRFDMVLADIGVSSPHLDTASRGFSISSPGPLDMRMDTSQVLTASTIVNEWDMDRLVQVLRDYGEEPRARYIAKLITAARPIATTTELAYIVAQAYPGHSKRHPATRTFQAIRIAVNDELSQLARVLPLAAELLKPGGRLAVISFHSLEDRIVKAYFSEYASDGFDTELRLLTKKPITGSANEIVTNPRARSAKLRAVVKK
jgi:16S rRNA (cytosine1402-N4)-methyltransferase